MTDMYIPRLVPGIIGGVVAGSIIFTLAVYSVQRKAKNRNYLSGLADEEPKDDDSDSGSDKM